MTKKWIQAATEKMEKKGTVGSLHRAAGVPEGKKIPESKLSALSAKAERTNNTALKKKIQFARNVS